MKVLMINGSPRKDGNTSLAVAEMEKVFNEKGIETVVMPIGIDAIRGCMHCNGCSATGRCVIDDAVNKAADVFAEADGLVVATPVYFSSANGTVVSFLDRLFYSTQFDKTMKVGAAVAVARRGGLTATFDELNKYFTISGMPVASSQYWNGLHGMRPGEAAEDAEGLQQMRTLARNMAYLMEAIADKKAKDGLPEKEPGIMTNFVR